MSEWYELNGFESSVELNDLVCLVPLGTEEDQQAFDSWKMNNGNKQGLLRLLGVYEYSDGEIIFRDKYARDRWFQYLRNKRLREYQHEVRLLQRKLKDDLMNIETEQVYALLGNEKDAGE